VQCARLGVTPLLLDRTGEAGGLVANAWSIENYPGLEPIDGAAYVRRLRAHLNRFGLDVVECDLRAVRRAGDRIVLDTDADSIETRTAILALGTTPRRLELPGSDELFYELRLLLERKPGQAVVVGGGEMAFDHALSLTAGGAAVDLLIRGPGPRTRGRLADLVAREPRISVRCATELLAVTRHGDAFHATVGSAKGKDRLRCDGLLAAVGRRSALLRLGGGLDLSSSGMISTPVPGLFVVGDARLGSLGQVGIAVGDGLQAAMLAIDYLERDQ
jgi:thioredoxin reductase (NADPH)